MGRGTRKKPAAKARSVRKRPAARAAAKDSAGGQSGDAAKDSDDGPSEEATQEYRVEEERLAAPREECIRSLAAPSSGLASQLELVRPVVNDEQLEETAGERLVQDDQQMEETAGAWAPFEVELGHANEAAGPVFGPKRWRKLLRSSMDTIRAERGTQTALPKLSQGASLQLQVALEDWAAMFFARCQRAARHRRTSRVPEPAVEVKDLQLVTALLQDDIMARDVTEGMETHRAILLRFRNRQLPSLSPVEERALAMLSALVILFAPLRHRPQEEQDP